MDLEALIDALRRHWIVFWMVTIVVFAAGMALVFLRPLHYVSAVRLLVTVEGETTANAYQNDDVALKRINTYIPLLSSAAVTRPVQQRLGLHLSDSEMGDRISATQVPPRTALIDVQVTGDTAKQAQTLAQTLADEFVTYTQAIETPTGLDQQKIHTQVVNPAGSAQDNRQERNLLAGIILIAAILMGFVAVWLRGRSHRDLRSG